MTTPNFGNYAALDVNGENVQEFELEMDMENNPILKLKSATEANQRYTDENLRLNGKKAMSRRKSINAKYIEEVRDIDRKLFAKHVIVGWEHVVDMQGKAVEFNAENCEAFLRILPARFFDELRGFAQDPENFVDQICKEKGKN